MRNIDLILETIIFRSRWFHAPFYLGLISAIISILTLVDTTLIDSLDGKSWFFKFET